MLVNSKILLKKAQEGHYAIPSANVIDMESIKNQIHGMMLGYGIETKAAQFQSKKKRQELLNDLEDHDYSQFTASSLEVTLNILDEIYAQVKKIEGQIKEMTKENEDVELLKTMPGIGFVGATTIA